MTHAPKLLHFSLLENVNTRYFSVDTVSSPTMQAKRTRTAP